MKHLKHKTGDIVGIAEYAFLRIKEANIGVESEL